MKYSILSSLLASSPATKQDLSVRYGREWMPFAEMLSECGRAESVLCPCCYDHIEEVIYETGTAMIPCPELGFCSVSIEDLKLYSLSINLLAKKLAVSLTMGQPETKDGKLWRLGLAITEGKSVEVWLDLGSEEAPSTALPYAILTVSDSSRPHTICISHAAGDDLRLIPEVLSAVAAFEPALPRYSFRKSGDVWRISFEGKSFDMKDQSGFRLLSWLLHHPNRFFAIHELLEFENPGSSSLPDYSHQDVTDVSAIKNCIDRLMEKAEEREEFDDLGSSYYREEAERLKERLQKDTGLLGKARAFSDERKKAYRLIRQNLDRAIAQIETISVPMGSHLRSAIRKNNGIEYRPPDDIVWQE